MSETEAELVKDLCLSDPLGQNVEAKNGLILNGVNLVGTSLSGLCG